MSEANGDHERQVSSVEFIQHSLSEIVMRLERIEARQHVVEKVANDCADNTFRLLLRRDPLTWAKRGIILGSMALVGSTFGAAVIHTVYLAFFRK